MKLKAYSLILTTGTVFGVKGLELPAVLMVLKERIVLAELSVQLVPEGLEEEIEEVVK